MSAPRPITHPIRTKREYDLAIKEIDTLLDQGAPKGSPEYDRLDLLSVLAESYETVHYHIPKYPVPQEMVDFMLEQKGVTRDELAPLMGGQSGVSDFFSGRLRLSLPQLRKLRKLLRIPPDLLIE